MVKKQSGDTLGNKAECTKNKLLKKLIVKQLKILENITKQGTDSV